MKKIICLMIICMAICVFTSCDKENENHNAVQDSGSTVAENEGYTFIDDLGREVTVKAHDRVASLLGSYADIWMLAGGNVCASADDAWVDFGLELSNDAVNLGKLHELNLEALLSSNPDLILASPNITQQMEWKENLEGAGLTVAYFDVSNFDSYLNMLKICTDITGNSENYERYGTDIKHDIEEVLNRVKDKDGGKVLVMRASATSIRAKNSKGNVLGEMLSDFNCINIADSDKSLLENLSVESIMLENPDRIFIVQTGDDIEGTKKNVEKMFSEDPLWSELDAVKNDRVYYMEKELYNLKPNGRWAQAYEKLEEILYAE